VAFLGEASEHLYQADEAAAEQDEGNHQGDDAASLVACVITKPSMKMCSPVMYSYRTPVVL
jgi:hypothetical protein